MIGPGEVMIALIVIGFPVIAVILWLPSLLQISREAARRGGTAGRGEGGAICRLEH